MVLINSSSSYRKDIDDGAICKPEMLKDFTEERDRVQKGCLVLRQDRFFACNRLIETLLKTIFTRCWPYV